MYYPKVCYTLTRKKITNFIKIVIILLSFPASLAAQNSVKEYVTISNDSINSLLLDPYLHYYNDEDGNLSIDEVSNDIIQKQFSDSLQLTKNTKYIWVYFNIKINRNSNKEWLITTKTKNNFLYIKNNTKWITHHSSDYLYSNRCFIVPKFSSDSLETIYMQVIPHREAKNGNKLGITLNQKHSYEDFFFKDTIFYMFVVGIVFGMFFYNLFLAISTKSYSYYLYSFSVFFTGLRFLLFSSLFKEFFIEYDYQALFSNSCTSINIIFYTLFSLAYFKEGYKSKWTKVIISLLLFHVLASGMHIYSKFYYFDSFYSSLGNFSIVSIFISLFIFSIYKAKNKSLGAKGFLLANSFLVPIILAAVIVSILSDSNTDVGYTLSFGSVIQLLLFSFALGSRFNLIEKQITQKENEKLELEKNQILEVQKLTARKNLELEEKVTQRTARLQEANEEMGQLIEELDTTNDSLQNTFAELKLQHNKVTDSIYYASNIQEAILPNLSKIKTTFSELFVFFRPRDVVSGDFYWYIPLEDEKYLLGAFDCTGHGVPGAFMSMISSQILNETVLIKNKIMPNEILDSLRKKIYFSLKQNENFNKDGLDACLILIDKKEEILYFSGAKNPLYYIKDNQPDKLQTLKGDNLYIGGRYNETDKFTLHTIPFHQKDTQFYLCSDGVQDQFGGKEGRKLLRKIFKEYLLENATLPSEQQITFWDTFMTEWQGENEQTDDMLLIGIRP